MRIFVAYGYNDRDRWVPELVFPLIRAFGDEVVTGDDLQGERITDAVRRQIARSDALIAFATRREQIGTTGRWVTHRWVWDELAHALAFNRMAVEVREAGVDDQGGIAGDRQRITYEEGQRDRCVVELVKTLGRWHRGTAVKLQLLPEELREELFPLLRNPNLRCCYRVLLNGEIDADVPTTIFPIKGGLFIQAKDVPRDSLVQVQVECEGNTWISSFESTDALGIRLQKG
jgi:hypothetical protein